MTRQWLRPFAVGAAIVSLAATASWFAAANLDTRQGSLILKYVKPTGLHPAGWHEDPKPNFTSASAYLVAVAKTCAIPKWRLKTNGIAHDADDIAELSVEMQTLTDMSFNCLAKNVKPPLITLERKSN